MIKMVIKTWSQPIHEHQEGEVSRERTYLEQFFIFPGNLREYSEFIDYVFKKLHLCIYYKLNLHIVQDFRKKFFYNLKGKHICQYN